MKGQWIGDYKGNNTGRILLDIDEVDDCYHGYAILEPPQSVNLPILFTRFQTPDKALPQTLDLNVLCFDPRSLEPTEWSNVEHLFPGVTFTANTTATFDIRHEILTISWTSAHGGGTAAVQKSQASKKSSLTPLSITSWADFKSYVETLPPNRFAFRGQQSNIWRLRTSFHRTGRANLEIYSRIDLPTVAKHVSAQTKHLFNLKDDQQYGAFVSLIQHHGFPTPLLDWTHSPYVAAFFAYRNLPKQRQARFDLSPPKVRIFQFALHDWNRIPQLLKLAPLPPHVSILDAIALENSRMLPQQAISTVTNVDDIETYIQSIEAVRAATYLQAIDLPVADRAVVSRDLTLMGITAGSLLPGLDGSCEQLRDRFFPI